MTTYLTDTKTADNDTHLVGDVSIWLNLAYTARFVSVQREPYLRGRVIQLTGLRARAAVR